MTVSDLLATRQGIIESYNKAGDEILEKCKSEISTFQVMCLSAKTVASCTTVGAVVGAVGVGLIFKAPKTGAAIGGVLGFGVGVYLAIESMDVLIEESTYYAEWKEEAIQKETFKAFKDFISAHPDLQDLIDYHSGEIPTCPVICPNGHKYDRCWIEEWLDKQDEKINEEIEGENRANVIKSLRENICPLRGRPYTKDQLVYDHHRVKEIVDAINGVLKLGIDSLEQETIIVGLNALADSIRQNRNSIIAQTTVALAKEAKVANMSKDDCVKLAGINFDLITS